MAQPMLPLGANPSLALSPVRPISIKQKEPFLGVVGTYMRTHREAGKQQALCHSLSPNRVLGLQWFPTVSNALQKASENTVPTFLINNYGHIQIWNLSHNPKTSGSG